MFSTFEGLPAFNGNNACSGLWAVDPDGSGLVRLVMPAGEESNSQYYPSFSPDGRLLAFEVFKGSGEGYEVNSEVSLLEGASGDVRSLATTRSSLFVNPHVIWSPKSESALIVSAAEDRGRISRVDIESGETEALVEGEQPASVAWAPDGSQIAYGTSDGGIWLMDADGGNRRKAVRDAGSPVWAPDSRRLAFFRPAELTEADDASIWLVDADGSNEKQLVEGVQHLPRSVLWSPQGDRLTFLREAKKPIQPGAESDFYLLELDGGREMLRARAALPLAWSQDGKRILFARYLTVGPDTVIGIYIGSAEGTDERLVAVTDEEDIGIGSFPVWQPTGGKLVPATGAMAPRKEFDFCIRRLDRLRSRLSKRSFR